MKRVVLMGIALLLLLRAVAGARLDLFGDEAFYWWCAQHPAPAYADHPFVTALFVRLGTLLLGDDSFGVRLLFLVCSALLPFAILALARPIIGDRKAWLAAGVSQCVPMLAFGGAAAVPDVPLLLFAVGELLFLERATRTGRLTDWLAAGACGALGLCTHYRFLLIVGAAGAFLLLTRKGRAQWRGAGPWLASAVAVCGVLPVLLFNLQMQWRPLHYQLSERHAASADFSYWLVHPVEQAVVMTPFLYAALLCALWSALKGARGGDSRRALLVCFALVPLGTYFLASPFSDKSHDYLHWPMVGYLPLLVLVPDVLEGWSRRGRAGRAAALLAPGLGLAAALLGCVDLTTGWPGVSSLHGPFEGWSELAAATRARLPAGSGAVPLILADNYIVGSELQFKLGAEADVYVADHPENHRHGRALQLEIWGRDEAGFTRRAGADALVVEDLSRKTKPHSRPEWIAHLASLFEVLTPDGTLSNGAGEDSFRIYAGHGVRDGASRPP